MFSNLFRLLEGTKQEVLIPYFWLSAILLSRVPSTPTRFIIVAANKNLAFFHRLYANNMHGLFENASRALFRVGSLITMVVDGQDDVLGSGDLLSD